MNTRRASLRTLAEVSPPGFKGTVRAMKTHGHTGKGKGKIDNPYALAWWMKKKGDKPHYKDQESSTFGKPEKKKKYKEEAMSIFDGIVKSESKGSSLFDGIVEDNRPKRSLFDGIVESNKPKSAFDGIVESESAKADESWENRVAHTLNLSEELVGLRDQARTK